jgi:hypothetical protein
VPVSEALSQHLVTQLVRALVRQWLTPSPIPAGSDPP